VERSDDWVFAFAVAAVLSHDLRPTIFCIWPVEAVFEDIQDAKTRLEKFLKHGADRPRADWILADRFFEPALDEPANLRILVGVFSNRARKHMQIRIVYAHRAFLVGRVRGRMRGARRNQRVGR
jgi:hypothetical protein